MTNENTLPNTYKEGVPRVSQIVETIFPFAWEDRKRFEQWLDKHNVPLEAYMKEASEGGTAVHKALETIMMKGSGSIQPRWASFVSSGKQWLEDMEVKPISIEKYVIAEDESYQWTIDLIAKLGRKTYIIDWKTYGLAKHAYGLFNEEAKYKKPYDKLKKATLQLSLYAHACGVRNIAVVELLTTGYKMHILNRMSRKEIDIILKKAPC